MSYHSTWAAGFLGVLLPFLYTFIVKLASSAAVYISDSKISDDAQNGNVKAKKAMDLNKCYSNIELSVRFFSIISMVISGFFLYFLLTKFFPNLKLGTAQPIFLSFYIIIYPTVFWSIAFEAPKKLSAYNPSKYLYSLVDRLSSGIGLMSVPIWLCKKLCDFVIVVFGKNPNEIPNFVTEEEIRMMVDEGEEKGTIENMERRMINSVFDFDNHDIAEVMTHRTEVVALPITASFEDVTKLSIETGYSRIAIYEEDIDKICGFVYIKDLLKFIGQLDKKEFNLKNEMRKPIYLPESCSCSDAFSIFKKEKTQIAVVVDEYGGTYGIVTMEDLLETIFGNIQDEYDNEKLQYIDMGNGTYILDGALAIPDVEQLFDIKLSDEYEFDTIGGLVTELLGKVPTCDTDAKEISVGGLLFKVIGWDERRITKLEAKIVSEEE